MNKQNAKLFFGIFAALIFMASAILTFGFFYTFLPTLIPAGVLGGETGALVTGLLGMLIFDGGALVWLRIYLSGCENNDQRAIALQTSVIDLTGSAIASFVQVVLSGSGLVNLEADTLFVTGWAALLSVSGVLVWNFTSIWRFHRGSNESKIAIREGERMALIEEAEREQENLLDHLVAEKTGTKLASAADSIAETQSNRIVERRKQYENAKGFGGKEITPTSPEVIAAESPLPLTTVTRKEASVPPL